MTICNKCGDQADRVWLVSVFNVNTEPSEPGRFDPPTKVASRALCKPCVGILLDDMWGEWNHGVPEGPTQ